MEENQKKLAKQKFKLESINEQVNDIISNKNEKNDKNEEKKKKHNPNIAVVVED